MGKKKKKKKKKVLEPNLAGPTRSDKLSFTYCHLFHDYNSNCHHQTPKLLVSFRPLSFPLGTLHQQQGNRLFFFFLFDFFF
jgi:hypothetical protein